MSLDHCKLIDAVANYGKAMERFGKSGGTPKWEIGSPFPPCSPEQKEAAKKWSEVLRLLDAHFSKSWWRRLLNL